MNEQSMRGERSRMLKEVQSLDFALHEAALFLDINKNDKSALKYFNHYQPLAKAARAEYEDVYGPLTHQSQENIEHWKWTDGPWPWECGG